MQYQKQNNMTKKFNMWYTIIFKDENDLLLSMLLPVRDVEDGLFSYTQEVAIDGVVYDATLLGIKDSNSKDNICKFHKVNLHPYDEDEIVKTCEIVDATYFFLKY